MFKREKAVLADRFRWFSQFLTSGVDKSGKERRKWKNPENFDFTASQTGLAPTQEPNRESA